MLTVPKEFAILMTTFAPLFTKRVWHHVQVLLVGAILAPGKRTVTAALRVMGLAQAKSLSTVSSCLEPCRLVEPGRGAPLVAPVGVHPRARWAAGHGA